MGLPLQSAATSVKEESGGGLAAERVDPFARRKEGGLTLETAGAS